MAEHTLLADVLIFLAAAVGIVALFRAMRMSPVLGYLAAGAAIGPHALGAVGDVAGLRTLAEFGVVFLLFMIGLELSWERLKAMRLHVFGFGTLQWSITGILIGGVAYAFGYSVEASILIGGALAMSSTAVVLQVLAEKGEQASQVGRLSLAVLILQDFAVVPLLVLVHLFASSEGNILSALGTAGLRAVVVLLALFVGGRLLLRPVFRMIAGFKNQELFAATTLLIVLGTSFLTEHFGLSMALGAFMAGLLIAETEFTHQVEADILPFKGLFLGLFFMAVGMSIDLDVLVSHVGYILLIVAALMFGKAAIIVALCKMVRMRTAPSLRAGFVLSQAGEFAFVLFTLAMEKGVLPQTGGQMLLVAVTISMALTPLAWEVSVRLGRALTRKPKVRDDSAEAETADVSDHVVIAGFGRMGRTVASFLTEERMQYLALDMSAPSVAKSRGNGYPVYYGDASRREVLSAVGIERAKVAIVTISDIRQAEKAVVAIRSANPDLPIIARAHDQKRVIRLEAVGANVAVAETLEASLQLAGALLRHVGTPEGEIHRVVERFRAHDYSLAQAIATASEEAAVEPAPRRRSLRRAKA